MKVYVLQVLDNFVWRIVGVYSSIHLATDVGNRMMEDDEEILETIVEEHVLQ